MRWVLISFALLFGSLIATAETPKSDMTFDTLLKQATGLKPEVLRSALNARACAAKQGVLEKDNVLTVIDYSLPSTKKRLWTIRLTDGHVLFHDFVAHGKNSGENRTIGVSNENGSLMTSVGAYKTANPYIGKNGYSMRLVGLENGFNDNAYPRAVVLHGAWYVSEQMIRSWGRLGRSWGCPAVRQEIATPLIDVIKEGSLLFAYYPDPTWLKKSKYLNGC